MPKFPEIILLALIFHALGVGLMLFIGPVLRILGWPSDQLAKVQGRTLREPLSSYPLAIHTLRNVRCGRWSLSVRPEWSTHYPLQERRSD